MPSCFYLINLVLTASNAHLAPGVAEKPKVTIRRTVVYPIRYLSNLRAGRLVGRDASGRLGVARFIQQEARERA